MISLGEMCAYLPHKKGFAGYATRYVDPAFGFALGWNYVLKYFIQTTNNVNAAGAVVQYWTLSVPIEAWMGACTFDNSIMQMPDPGPFQLFTLRSV
jgi:amino acid transporter